MKYKIYVNFPEREKTNNVSPMKVRARAKSKVASLSIEPTIERTSDNLILIKPYFKSLGYAVDWTPSDPQALYIGGVRIGKDEYGWVRSVDDYTCGTQEVIDNIMSAVSTKSNPDENKNGFISVVKYFTDNGYVVDEFDECPQFYIVNGLPVHKAYFVNYVGDNYDARQNTNALYAPESFLDELALTIPNNGYTSLKGIYSGKELMDKLAEYEFPPVETISAFSEDGLNQKLTEIQGWKNAGAELSYSVEEING